MSSTTHSPSILNFRKKFTKSLNIDRNWCKMHIFKNPQNLQKSSPIEREKFPQVCSYVKLDQKKVSLLMCYFDQKIYKQETIAGQMVPNFPMGVNYRMRCPGTRKLVNSSKKLRDCVLIVKDQYNTSEKRTKRSERRTRAYRFWKCCECCQK